jgi:hypothetical protein
MRLRFQARCPRVGVRACRNDRSATFWGLAEAEKVRVPPVLAALIDREQNEIEVSADEACRMALWIESLVRGVGETPGEHTEPLSFFDPTTGETVHPPK